MTYTGSITSQGQLTVPKKLLKALGITDKVSVIIRKEGDTFKVEPVADFWSLGGSMKSDISLSDEELRAARKSFETDWADKV